MFYDFFAGAGLAGLGLGERWNCLWANDIDPRKGEVFNANFGSTPIVVDDVGNVDAASLPGTADLAWASFPCQDLSLAGWRRGMTAERSGAFWEFWRIIRELQDDGRAPKMLTIENVAGLLYGDNFTGLCEALASLGYRFGAVMIDARHFVPHSRLRIFIIAIEGRIDVSTFTCEQSDSVPAVRRTPKLVKTVESFPPGLRKFWVWWNLPKRVESNLTLADVVTEPDEHDPSWFSDSEVERLLSLMNSRNRQKVEAAANGGMAVLTVYKRIRNGRQQAEVRNDGLSGCLRVPGGGSSRQTVIIVQKGKIKARLMNRRELARLMGAPDSFKLPDNYNSAYRAMGDAVVVPAVRWLSDNLLTHIAEKIRNIIPSSDQTHQSQRLYLNRSLKRIEQWKQNGN